MKRVVKLIASCNEIYDLQARVEEEGGTNNFLLATLMVRYYSEKYVFRAENKKLTSGVVGIIL